MTVTTPPLRLSIVATVRNERETIASFVDSLLSMNFRANEIIIVDGNSTDGTRKVLDNYVHDNKIVLISEECNIARGRNLGIARASNELIAVTDAGGLVDPDWLGNIARCFTGLDNPDVIAANFKFDCHTPFEEAVVLATFSPKREVSDLAKYYPSSRSVAFRKSAWQKAGGYPDWLYAAEDTLFNIRLRQLGFKFVFCKDAIVRWRPRETWRALAKQRFNFSRGNARVGIGTQGYIVNIKNHAAIFLSLIGGFFWPPLAILSFAAAALHVYQHLWDQAARASSASSSGKNMRWRVMLVMEYVRVINIFGFLVGRWDRLTNSHFAERQLTWMGVSSVSEIPAYDD